MKGEIFKLKKMLDNSKIEYEFIEKFDGFKLTINDIKDFEVVQLNECFGNKNKKLSINGLFLAQEEQFLDNEDIITNLIAEDVFDRIIIKLENLKFSHFNQKNI